MQPQIEFARHRPYRCAVIRVSRPVLGPVLDEKLQEEHDEQLIRPRALDHIAHLATTQDVLSNVCPAERARHLMISRWPPFGALTVVTRPRSPKALVGIAMSSINGDAEADSRVPPATNCCRWRCTGSPSAPVPPVICDKPPDRLVPAPRVLLFLQHVVRFTFSCRNTPKELAAPHWSPLHRLRELLVVAIAGGV
jgi:hypothetical protein